MHCDPFLLFKDYLLAFLKKFHLEMSWGQKWLEVEYVRVNRQAVEDERENQINCKSNN